MGNQKRANQSFDPIISSKYHPALQKVWILENKTSNIEKKTGIMVGDGRFELVFVTGAGYQTIRGEKTAFFGEGMYLGGQMDRPLDLCILPDTKVFFIKMQPWSIGLMSGFNMREALNETVPFSEINPTLGKKLGRYHADSQLEKILLVLSKELEMGAQDAKHHAVIKKCCQILDTGYTDFRLAKDHYLNMFGVSSRTIEQLFIRQIGLTPQKYANGMRLRNISEELNSTDFNGSFSNLAYKHGFYDQAHFIRFFKEYWGVTPKQLPKKEVFITNSKEHFRYYTI